MSFKYYMDKKNNVPLGILKSDLPLTEMEEQSNNPFAPGFKEIKKDYYPPEFYKLRPEVMKKFGERCFICNEIASEIHHIDYNKMNSNIENLVLLCNVHHGQTNFNRDSWQKYFEKEMSKIYIKYKYEEEDFDDV